MQDRFEEEYNKLNKDQKEAVEAIEGPVMVVAGPGTGKTQILALRIANILEKGAGEANEILCLTFTNSGVKAMKKRLEDYIAGEAGKVRIATFHSFGLELIEEYAHLLDFARQPKLISDDEAVFLVDEILNNNAWEHIRPRTNPEMYFSDLKHLISILKRERISKEEFEKNITEDIENLKNDPDSISTRGESKGKIKKEIEKKIESLERTKEVVEFYKIYEEKKKELGLMDYDDVLEYAVYLAENFEDVQHDLREKYQYILVDEHQDSSGVQNSFLKAVWQGVEMPNIFVVGDDRQLIYAFSGANMDYFKEFAHIFGKAKLIILKENYRSTAPILDLAHSLLTSSIAKDKLNSNKEGNDLVMLNEYAYSRDEIIGAGLYFKQKIAEGVDPKECAVLVPKNYHARNAITTLVNMGLPVSSGKDISLFELRITNTFLNILKIIARPFDAVALSKSLLDSASGIGSFEAHKFLKSIKPDKMSIEDLNNFGREDGLFKGENAIAKWGNTLQSWVDELSNQKIVNIVSTVGNYIIDQSTNHDELLHNVEVVRTFIHLAEMLEQKNKNADIDIISFIDYLERLRSYGTHISVATFGSASGVQVMTLHRSKGLEYKCVWIAHMNEEVFMSEKKGGFTLPEKIKKHISARDMEIAKRELYVAITRAKEFCVISYATESITGGEIELAHIIKELPNEHFIKKTKEDTEAEILKAGPKIYTEINKELDKDMKQEMLDFVREHYADTKVSVTMLNNFFECPWKWYFRNFLKLPEPKSTSLALGSAVHETIEFILNLPAGAGEDKLPSDKKVEEYILDMLKKEGVNDEKEIKRLAKDAFTSVARFVKEFYPNLEADRQSERALQFRDDNFKHLLMYGKIDLTERTKEGNIIVTDFKTGSSKTSGMIEKQDEENRLSSYMRQLAMYSYLVYGCEKRDVAISKLLFLEADKSDKNVLYSTHIDKEEIMLLLRDIKDYDEGLSSGEWLNRKCYFNSYGKQGAICEYCKMGEMYKK